MATLLLAALMPAAQSQNHSDRQQLLKAWNQPFKGFRIIGNIYYVGTNNLACFLITSPEGHILVDTAMEESGPLVRANIEALGFKLKDIRIILSSHAHFDHVAGHADMKAATGAQVFATAPDAATLESGGRKGFHPLMAYKPVKVDRVIKDGEIVRLGNIVMTAHMVPGHTEGNTAWTTTIEDKGKTYAVVFAASMSINPGVRLVNNPTWPGIAEAYAASFVKLRSLKCDVFLGPHAPFFKMEEKVKLMTPVSTTNPFIDPEGYRDFLDGLEKQYQQQLAQERNARQ